MRIVLPFQVTTTLLDIMLSLLARACFICVISIDEVACDYDQSEASFVYANQLVNVVSSSLINEVP